jgi:rubrerythrin
MPVPPHGDFATYRCTQRGASIPLPEAQQGRAKEVIVRKAFVVLLALVLALVFTASAADKPVSYKARNILERAVQNEREAAARYDAYALKAAEEGYPGVANLFTAAARAERVHASRFEKAMQERGIAIPEALTYEPRVGTTRENLRAAAAAEVSERDGIYRDAIDAANDSSDAVLALVFDQTRDTEVEHANLMNAAVRKLEQLRESKTYYVCDDCGYTTDVELPLCCLCRTRHAAHKVH